MDGKPTDHVEIELTHHQLLSCNAETKTSPLEGKCGTVEFSSAVETPNKPVIFKENDSFSINISLQCNGKSNEKTEPVFNFVCKMKGFYQVFKCPESGITISGKKDLQSVFVSQLFPLIAQYATETISKMGYKNVQIPLFFPRNQPQETKPKKRIASKSNK